MSKGGVLHVLLLVPTVVIEGAAVGCTGAAARGAWSLRCCARLQYYPSCSLP